MKLGINSYTYMWSIGFKFICARAPSGRGLVEIEWLLETLRVSPHDFNVIVELWTPEQETVDQTAALEQAWAVESVSYLRKFILN